LLSSCGFFMAQSFLNICWVQILYLCSDPENLGARWNLSGGLCWRLDSYGLRQMDASRSFKCTFVLPQRVDVFSPLLPMAIYQLSGSRIAQFGISIVTNSYVRYIQKISVPYWKIDDLMECELSSILEKVVRVNCAVGWLDSLLFVRARCTRLAEALARVTGKIADCNTMLAFSTCAISRSYLFGPLPSMDIYEWTRSAYYDSRSESE